MAANYDTGSFKKALNRIIKDEINPLFIEEGFHIKGTSFFKIEPNFIKYIEVEYSRWNTGISFMFNFNLNIFSSSFNDPKSISLSLLLRKGDSLFRKRLGFLWNDENHSYEITPAADLNLLAKKIREDLIKYLFPFYKDLKSIEDVVDFLLKENKRLGRNEYSFRIAVMLAKAGKKEECKKYFQESIGVKEAIERTAKSFGIDL